MVMLHRTKFFIPQLDADPSSPVQEDAWVLKTMVGGSGAGSAFAGFLLAIPQGNAGGSPQYDFSYRTKEDTTVVETLT